MGTLWLLLCIQRGVLQGIGRYGLVGGSLIGEASGRLVFALALTHAGLDATGALLGQGVSVAFVCVVLAPVLHRRLAEVGAGEGGSDRSISRLVRRAAVPLAALALFALLQNLDVIVVGHLVGEAAASDYAAVSVAAKAILWVAIGLGLFLLPEASRRVSRGEDGRPVLVRTLALVSLVGVPITLVYAVAGKLVLEMAFGPDLADASGALPWLAFAMVLLATVYLGVQFLLALDRLSFLVLLFIAAAVEPVLLAAIGDHLTRIAVGVMALELLLAASVVVLALRVGGHQTGVAPPLEAAEPTASASAAAPRP
jgi:O-antigen/teichoic acid export membrane protein